MKQNNLVIEATDQNFAEQVLKAEGPVLVDFYAPWCPPCKALAPTVESLAEQFQGRAKVVKLNIDDNAQSTAEFDIKALPTLVLFNDGKETQRQVGVPNDTQRTLAALLEGELRQGCACNH